MGVGCGGGGGVNEYGGGVRLVGEYGVGWGWVGE